MPITNYNSVPHYVDEGANVHIKKPTQPGAGTQPVTTPAAPQSATGYGYGQSKAAVPDAGSNVDTLRAAYEASKTPAATSPVTSPAAAAPAATVPAAETLEAVPAAAEGLSPYEARELASYRAQEDAVNRLYEARQRAQIQALRDAYDQNMLTYQAAREDIAPVFEAQKNATAAESERQRAAFNEYAAARGLNSGAGGQAELARGNVLAGNLNALNTEQARQETEIDRAIAALKAQYQNQIAQAKADNDYQRLAELLTEYRTQEQSLVNTSANQADEDYKAWAAQYNAYRDSVGDKQYAEQFNYQKERDAVSDDRWERQYALSSSKRSGSSGGGNSAKKTGDSGGSGEASYTGSQLVDYMISLGNDADAYAYLLGRGYRAADTENMWDFYRFEKARRAKEAEENKSKPAEVPLTKDNWEIWHASYLQGGRGDPEARFDSYEDYLAAWREYQEDKKRSGGG